MQLLQEVYPQAILTTDRKAAYFVVLKPYQYETAREALLHYARTKKFIPDPVELANIANRIEPVKALTVEEHETQKDQSSYQTALLEYRKKVDDYYHSCGIQTYKEFFAKRYGSETPLTSRDYAEWSAMAEKAGATAPPEFHF